MGRWTPDAAMDRVIALTVILAALGAPLGAQTPPAPDDNAPAAERCRGPEHREFDFWIGRWEVRAADGTFLGRNDIQPTAGGCGILEHWRGAQGGRGISVNTYDADLGLWTQRWVGDGATLWLEGGLEDGQMVLRGTAPRATPRGDVLDRIAWSPLPDGRVRQVWETSPDGGRSWRQIFEGFYVPAGDPPLPAATDSAAVRQAALDYIEGWFAGDSLRMARALAPELRKRILVMDEETGRRWIDDMGVSKLLWGTARGFGAEVPAAERRTEVEILDLFGNAASVRVDAGPWIDYLHVVKLDDGWRIINVLWERRQEGGTQP